MSTHEQRFALAAQAYSDAWTNRKSDRKACGGDAARLKAINDNLEGLHTQMLRAANEWLGETGPAAEAAFEAARTAKAAVDQARADAVEITERLAGFADLLDRVRTLIDKTGTAKVDEHL